MYRNLVSLMLALAFLCSGFEVAAISVEEEVKLGAEEHRKIIGRFGVYRDQELQAYITKVGSRVAKRVVERRSNTSSRC